MRVILLALFLLVGYGNCAFAQSASVAPEVISAIQSRYSGRVVSITPNYSGNNQIQIVTQDNKVIIVTIDSYGNIINVQE